MKERPILFSAPMVRALLDGSKTQTRRVVKPQPGEDAIITVGEIGTSRGAAYVRYPNEGGICCRFPCPYGQPGDHLWVRESWRIGAWSEDDGEIAVDYMADNHSRREWLQVPEQDDFEKYWLQCCDDCDKSGIKTGEDDKYHWEPGQSPCRIRPSIFMPRWASRITLEITGVRVERLQDISEADALAEGVESWRAGWDEKTAVEMFLQGTRARIETHEGGIAKRLYMLLWESINGPGSWDANPWVWVIEFKRVIL